MFAFFNSFIYFYIKILFYDLIKKTQKTNNELKKKYTKAELISQIKGLKNNPTLKNRLFNYFYIFKQILIKFTFLALIIKIFKRFRIIRRLWLITNTVVMSIFGISMLDLYGLSIISAFITEITSISANIINYLTNTKFYSIISGYLGYKIETPTRIEPITKIQSEVPKIEDGIRRNSKVASWFEKEEVIETNDSPFYKNRYFIYGVIFVASCMTYYYFGEDLKIYSISLWEWLRGRRPGDNPPANPPINPQGGPSSESTRMNPITSFFGLNKNKPTILEELINQEEASFSLKEVQLLKYIIPQVILTLKNLPWLDPPT
jgi:hypothetical protein